jgi:hypothetical protein
MSYIFIHFKFHIIIFIFRILVFSSKTHKSTLYAGLLAAEDFPAVFDLARKSIRVEFYAMVRHPIVAAERAVIQTFDDVTRYVVHRHQALMNAETALRNKVRP